MARKHIHRWLHEEVEAWSREGLIRPEQAETLRERYPLPEAGLPWGTIVFSSLGAVIIGLGVILLLAYNWDAIPKFGKLALVFGVVGAAHAAGLRLFLGGGRFRGLGEGLCLLGTMLFGAGIWLVAQIYHIQEHFPNAFLVWGAGALLLALAMPSTPQAVLSTVLLSAWCGAERIGFDASMFAAPVLLAGVLLPFAWIQRSRLLLAVLLPALTLLAIFVFPFHGHEPWPIPATLLSLGALWLGLRFLAPHVGGFPKSSAVFGFYGWVCFLLPVFVLTFSEAADHLMDLAHDDLSPAVLTLWLVPAGLALTAWGVVAYRRFAGKDPVEPGDPGFEMYLVPLGLVLALCTQILPAVFGNWIGAGLFNFVFLGLAVAMMARGCRHGLLKPTIVGSLLLVALTFARYFDLFESLLARGVVFIVIGAVVFAEGILYARSRKRKQGVTS